MDPRYIHANRGYENNDPPIKVGQVWVAYIPERDEPFRKIRILAPYPDADIDGRRKWIYEDLPAHIRVDLHQPRVGPEFNIRYVFNLREDGK